MTSNRNPVHYMQHPPTISLELASLPAQEWFSPPLPLGLICNTDKPFHIGERISISAPKQAQDLYIEGEIAWCRTHRESYQVGVAFHSSNELYKIRMLEQLCHIEDYRRSHPARYQDGKQGAALEWIEKFAAHFPTDGL